MTALVYTSRLPLKFLNNSASQRKNNSVNRPNWIQLFNVLVWECWASRRGHLPKLIHMTLWIFYIVSHCKKNTTCFIIIGVQWKKYISRRLLNAQIKKKWKLLNNSKHHVIISWINQSWCLSKNRFFWESTFWNW